jgi:AAA domain
VTTTYDAGQASYSALAGQGGQETEYDPAKVFEIEAQDKAQRLRLEKRAREILAEEEADKLELPKGIILTDFLEQEDENPGQLIKGVWNYNTPVLLQAQFKAGKTTVRDNAVKSIVDGYDFLDRFQVNKLTEGRVAIIDLELSSDMLRKWLRRTGIKNTDRVVVYPMRGQGAALNLLLPKVRQRWVAKLTEDNCKVLIVDCLKPILDALGLDENREAGRFLNGGVDALVAETKIDNCMVIQHMGHVADRARGDSSMLGWGDSWKITRETTDDPSSQRYFSAYGRDIDVHQGTLVFNETNRHLKLEKGSKADTAKRNDWLSILPWLKEHQPIKGESAVVAAFRKGNEHSNPEIPDNGYGQHSPGPNTTPVKGSS